MRRFAAMIVLAGISLLVLTHGAESQPVPSEQICRPIEPMIARIIASAGADPVRRFDFAGDEAARLIQAINAEPPESAFAGTHLVLLERDGYPSLIGVADESGCFAGGAQLAPATVERVFGDRS